MAIVNDSFGNVYVANYEGNSVTMIETSSKAIAAGDNITTIPVGEGPNAIDINSKDEILVVCGLGNIIYKIYNKKSYIHYKSMRFSCSYRRFYRMCYL